MKTNLIELKLKLERSRREITAAHREGADGFATSLALTRAVDQTVCRAWASLGGEADRLAAVVALGGYGRQELSPASDLDVMVLCESGDDRAAAEEVAQQVLHSLWDTGVDLGHSVRTVEEAIGQNGTSPEIWAGLLESRPLCGSMTLLSEFRSRLAEAVDGADPAWFVNQVLKDLDARHGRYGNSVKLLEPNIKKSAGALRDIHAALWLFRGTDPSYLVPPTEGGSATQEFVRLLVANGLLDVRRADAAVAAAGFLLRVRHEMHYQREGLHDTLEYGLQLQIAEALYFSAEHDATAVEVFMRQYYLHARTIDHLSRRLCRRFRPVVALDPDPGTGKQLGSAFRQVGSTIVMSPGVERLTESRQIFEAFLASAEHDAELDVRVQGAIESAHHLLNERTVTDAGIAALFRKILITGRVGRTLRMMNELNVLGSYIPEFGKLVAFFQHNVYHYFTADEHTLIAVERAESLQHGEGVLHDIYRGLRRRDHLAMAILLHDIAKPISVAGHESIGVDIARTVLDRIGMSDGFPLIAFLIRHHLVMEQVAFRRNIHDPQTIREFASRFDSPEQLDYLYVLTYADLSAVNMSVWTDWKAVILRNLYLRTAEVLRRKLTGADIDRFHASEREAAVEQVVTTLSQELPKEDVRNHLQGIGNDAYVSQFSEQEIAEHIRKGKGTGSVSTLFRQGEGYTEVTVIGTDAPYVLSHCCGVLSANDANIFDANIYTRDDGVFIDHFRVSDRGSGGNLSEAACRKIGEDLRHVMNRNLDIRKLFAAHRRKWKRRGELPVNPTTRIGLEFEENPRFTIIEIFAPDSVGFLYRVTETMSELGLDIHFAKIATRIDGVVDAFYVRENNGTPLSSGERREEVRSRLIKAIRELAAEHLSEEDPGRGTV